MGGSYVPYCYAFLIVTSMFVFSSLMRALMSSDLQAPHIEGEGITDGIDISTWTIKKGEKAVTYSVWDFAGQTIYYNTHQVNEGYSLPTTLKLVFLLLLESIVCLYVTFPAAQESRSFKSSHIIILCCYLLGLYFSTRFILILFILIFHHITYLIYTAEYRVFHFILLVLTICVN